MAGYSDTFASLMSSKFGVSKQIVKEFYLSTAGASLSDQLKAAAKKFAQKDINDTRDLESEFWQMRESAKKPKVMKGARQVLKRLKKASYKIIVWSGTRTDVIGLNLQQTALNLYVDYYIGNTPGSTQKVKGPGLIKEIAKHFQITTRKLQASSVVIGDGESDMIAGKTSKIPAIGITGLKTAQQLKSAGADFITKYVKDLPALLPC